MKFRPCIDIHNGKVKQIIGSSVNDNSAIENYISDRNADYYAELYKSDNLTGGHIILLNSADSKYAQTNINQAKSALSTFPNGLQIGGGVNDTNAIDWLNAGASHIIVTSYVFHDGILDTDRLTRLKNIAGKSNIVLDLSCRRYADGYHIMTNRWQYKTDCIITTGLLDMLADYCDEFLVHAVDVEGKNSGIDHDLCKLLGEWHGIPVTYAGGISSFDDIDIMKGYDLDFTIGSSLDLFGGHLKYKDIISYFVYTDSAADCV